VTVELTLLARPVERLLSVREAAARVRVSTPTVYGLCDRGELRYVRVSGGIRVRPADLEAYLARVRPQR
jgi:excisionase family DNA binding protein